VVVGFLFLWGIRRSLGRLCNDPRECRLGFLVIALGGGVDWVPWLLARSGLDLASPFARTYDWFWNWNTTGSLTMPHWVLAHLFVVMGFGALVRERASAADRVVAFACPLLAWAVHPYTGLFSLVALALWPCVDALVRLARLEVPDGTVVRERLRRAAPGLLAAPIVAAWLLWSCGDAVVAATAAGAWRLTHEHGIGAALLAYGPWAPLAWFGWRATTADSGPRRDLLLAWALGAILLSCNSYFSPFKFQYLVHLPLSLLAARGVLHLAANPAWVARRLAHRRCVAAALVLGAVGVVLAPFKDLGRAGDRPQQFARTDELSAYAFLRARTDGIVLADPTRGARIAWLAAHPVYCGHWFMTVDHARKAAELRSWFSRGTDIGWRRGFAAGTGARWVFDGPEERRHGFESSGLGEVVFEVGEYRIVELPGR
jgi:hypothetical protein